ncbi:MAG: hypothetical protein ABJO01_15330 [Parasphingorhabdus sp.]|uniref:hypothetical protein n=1 Tax=Parasphingorhabdus sp. TaxID=2709688 RepID=UPI003299F1EC
MWERICWAVLALIHLPPFAALVRPALIEQLYGIHPDDPNFPLILHRAALFGVVAIACLWAAVDSGPRKLTVVVTALSMISFLVIFFLYGQPEKLQNIAIADAVGIPFLAFVAWKTFAVD